MNKRMKIALGVLVIALAASAGAIARLSGSGNGYETVFRAFEKFVFEAKNVSIDFTMEECFDGASTDSMRSRSRTDGANRYYVSLDETGEIKKEEYTIAGKRYYNVDHDEKTYESYSYNSADITLEADDTDENRTIARLIKLYADFITGDVKNRFVRERTETGSRYTVSLTQEQLPEVVSLFMELLNSTVFDQTELDCVYVDYEDYSSVISAYYREKTGEELNEHILLGDYENAELRKAYNDFRQEMKDFYTKMGEEVSQNAYVYVYENGKADVYESEKAYYQIKGLSAEIYMEEGLTDFLKGFRVDTVKAVFDISKDGMPEKADFLFKVLITDVNDAQHALECRAEAKFFGYGQTTFEIPDFASYTNLYDIKTEVTYEEVKETISFLGKEYEITYENRVEKVIE